MKNPATSTREEPLFTRTREKTMQQWRPSTAINKYIELLKKKLGASIIAQLVKNLPTMQKTPVQLLSQEDPLEKG